MKTTFTYNGYCTEVQFDEGDKCFFGRISGISDIVGFHGDTVEEFETAFQESVDDYLEFCKEIGKTPPVPVLAD
jgi:predicted HicB family RNase H-like nuclease